MPANIKSFLCNLYMRIATDLVAMELNDALFSNHSSSNETRITESDVEAATHPLVTLFGLP